MHKSLFRHYMVKALPYDLFIKVLFLDAWECLKGPMEGTEYVQ